MTLLKARILVEEEPVERADIVFLTAPHYVLEVLIDRLQTELFGVPDPYDAVVAGIAFNDDLWLPLLEKGSVRKNQLAAPHLLSRRQQTVHQPVEIPGYAVIEQLVHLDHVGIHVGSCCSPPLLANLGETYTAVTGEPTRTLGLLINGRCLLLLFEGPLLL